MTAADVGAVTLWRNRECVNEEFVVRRSTPLFNDEEYRAVPVAKFAALLAVADAAQHAVAVCGLELSLDKLEAALKALEEAV